MPTKEKPKPKTNRAKFTIAKKEEKPKPKTEKPEKEPKQEKKEPEIKVHPPKKVEPEIIEHEQEQPKVEETSQEDETPVAPEIHAETQEEVQHEEPEQEEPAAHFVQSQPENPFAMTSFSEHTPLTPQHENITTAQTTEPTQHLPQETHNPLDNPELSPTLPKEEIHTPTMAAVTVETENKGKNFVLYFILVALVAFFVGLGSMAAFTFGLQKVKLGNLNPLNLAKSPTPTEQMKPPTATPVPTKAVDLSTYKIKILNGSGMTGGASKLKNELTSAGFTVVSTGNADKSNYTDTSISAKKDIDPAYLDKLKEVLKKEYSLASDSQLPAGSSKEADLIITIGSSAAK